MKYAIVGKGRSGQAANEFLKQQGQLAEFLDDADKTLTPEHVLKFDRLVLSPGVPRTHPAIQAALQANKPVYNEIDLAAPWLPDCHFVGITGTNGKSTTTALLGHIVTLFEPNTFVGGNLGRPLCEGLTAGERLKYAILELSSFQLETLSRLKLEVAVLLNLSPDHLDRYPNLEAYYATKRKIFDLLKPDGYPLPLAGEGDFGLPKSGEGVFSPAKTLIGRHNLQNQRAAILAAQALGIPDKIIQKGLDTFPGIAHRLEILGVKQGVTWVNDSKATTVASVIAALACFESGVHLILGGLGKGVSYESLVQAALGRVKAVYLIGQDASVIERAFTEPLTPTLSHKGRGRIIHAGTLKKATALAQANARPGDTILLSPACASYDQFKNFEERGEVFRSLFHGF